MKKAIILILSFIVFITVIIFTLNFIAKKEEDKKYIKIEESAIDAAEWFLKASKEVDIDYEEPHTGFVQFDFLLSNGYLKKDDIYDINNINTCDGYVVYTIDNNKITCIHSFIKCKKYETTGYNDNNVEKFSCNN